MTTQGIFPSWQPTLPVLGTVGLSASIESGAINYIWYINTMDSIRTQIQHV